MGTKFGLPSLATQVTMALPEISRKASQDWVKKTGDFSPSLLCIRADFSPITMQDVAMLVCTLSTPSTTIKQLLRIIFTPQIYHFKLV
jgi:hypothetical protein